MSLQKPLTNYDVLFWDLDDTLLDFKASEKYALRYCWKLFGLGECSEEQVRRYSEINEEFWARLERGELTKPQVLLGRYESFFREEGIDTALAADFNRAYENHLSDTAAFLDHADDLLRRFRAAGVRQYLASNGVPEVQEKKLERSGLYNLLDGVFISDNVGADKPSPLFFRRAIREIETERSGTSGGEHLPGDRILMIGDSLGGDVLGGMNAGIHSCWYNRRNRPLPPGYYPNYVVANLGELEEIVLRL